MYPRKVRGRSERSFVLVFLLAVLASALLLLPATGEAHAPDQSYVFVQVHEDRVEGRVEITVTDLNAALDLTLPEDGSVTVADLYDYQPAIIEYLAEHVALAPDAAPTPVKVDKIDLHSLPLGQYLRAHFSFQDLSAPPATINMDYSVLFDKRPSHRGMLVVEHNWKTGTFNDEANVALIFAPDDTQKTYKVGGSVLQGFVAMIGQGAHHIWIGIDHILFLLALLLPSVVQRREHLWVPVEGLRPALIWVAKVVTVFTVAHTITLSAAALGALSLPSRFVESIIALSIAIAAADILWRVFGRRIWWVVFVFGLFHGFGFASVLRDIGIGGEFLFLTLLGFNLSVELGQFVIVAAVFPVLFLIRRLRLYTKFVLPGGAVALIAISLYWFIERGFGVDLPLGSAVRPILDIFT